MSPVGRGGGKLFVGGRADNGSCLYQNLLVYKYNQFGFMAIYFKVGLTDLASKIKSFSFIFVDHVENWLEVVLGGGNVLKCLWCGVG